MLNDRVFSGVVAAFSRHRRQEFGLIAFMGISKAIRAWKMLAP